MASINIYINDSMKEEMASVEANWSEICRQAITMEMSRIKGSEITYEPKNFDLGNWDHCSFEESFNNDSVIIKPYVDHADPKLRNTVKVASQWLEEIKREIAIARLDGNSLGEFFQGVRKIEVLEPGKTWKTGYLKINYYIDFYFEDDNPPTDTLEAEIVENQEKALMVTSSENHREGEIDHSLQLKELEHRGIISVDLNSQTSQDREIPMMYPESYTPIKKTLEEFFSFNKSNLSVKIVKQLWKEWYDHKLLINSGDISAESFLEEEDQREGEISGYIDHQYFQLRNEFFEELENNFMEVGFFHYDVAYFSSFLFDLFYFTKEIDFRDLNIDLFAKVNFPNIDELPHKSGLYFIRENNNLYGFGCTYNLYTHWENHKLNKRVTKDRNLEILFIIFDSQRYLANIVKKYTPYYLEKITLENNPFLN
ncbi:hypothetical protein WEU38_11220 [Cyanobacterium aponinum AL20118]|uniref:Uncharacterized protein n=1 Tax=Cyanobacterium aponinum AL20115 TaxID=3090662 RepID=A0AAF1C182_9CHRO|nr:hypothetical protein [Cyanobacterium aponinum]WPF87383.1 hypothetical protein SAY89_11250 [Cyanobacterium aponinum AL20115]